MKELIKATTFALFVISVAPTVAEAATYTFDLNETQSGGDAATTISSSSFAITSDDLTGTFSGLYLENAVFDSDTLTGGNISDAASLDRLFTGAGVCGAGTCFDDESIHTVDGVSEGGADFDFIEFGFSTMDGSVDVTLTQLVFGYVGRFPFGGGTFGYMGTNGSFEILTDGFDDDEIGIGDTRVFSGTAPNVYQNGVVDLAAIDGLTDSFFGVKTGENGSWKLRAVTVDFTPTAVIPLPAAGWLLIAGLGGLIFVRLRS